MNRWFWSVLWLVVFTAALQGQSRESLLKSVTEASGWSPAATPITYDEKNVETLAGKRAPAIVSYGLNGAAAQTWNGPEGSVRLTLYEMLDPSAAYGLFTLERNIRQAGFQTLPLGTEGFRVANRSVFWQSKYVVKLEGSAAAMDSFGRIISESIFGQSRKPPVSTHLPPQNLVQGSEKYIVEKSGIGTEFNLDAEKLGFTDSVEIATAEYDVNGKPAQLVLLMFPTQQIAKRYAEQWDAESPDDSAFRKRAVSLLGLVRGTRDAEVAKAILDGVNLESQVTWNERPPDITLPEIILTIFTFIGIALFFTIVAGISFGGLRIFVKARYPDRVFDRPEDMEIIQLKLAQGVISKQLHE
jgi:hypothetical protein